MGWRGCPHWSVGGLYHTASGGVAVSKAEITSPYISDIHLLHSLEGGRKFLLPKGEARRTWIVWVQQIFMSPDWLCMINCMIPKPTEALMITEKWCKTAQSNAMKHYVCKETQNNYCTSCQFPVIRLVNWMGDIFWMSHSFTRAIVGRVTFKKCLPPNIYARTVRIEKPMAEVAAFLAMADIHWKCRPVCKVI